MVNELLKTQLSLLERASVVDGNVSVTMNFFNSVSSAVPLEIRALRNHDGESTENVSKQ